MGFIDEMKAKARANKKTIVLPESEDERTYKAAEAVLKEEIANVVIVGSEEEVAKNKGSYDISGAQIVDPATSDKTEAYIAKLVELRQKKGMTEEQAREILLTNYLYYGVMMVKMKDADGMVSGACHSTADTLRPCLQILKTKPGTKLVSAFFVMCVPDCEYGEHAGLGLVPGQVCPLAADLADPALKVPQIGWNALRILRPDPLFRYLRQGEYVYYVHSYYAKHCAESTLAVSDYSIPVTGAVRSGLAWGTQFHPEKSGDAGLRILQAFAEL